LIVLETAGNCSYYLFFIFLLFFAIMSKKLKENFFT